MYGETVATFSKIGNVKRFLQGYSALEERGSAEATLMVVTGEVGLGKTSTGRWFAVQNRLPYVVLKENATTGWLMADLCRSMGLDAPRFGQDRFNLIISEMVKRNKGIVVDEAEKGLADNAKVIEQLRIIGDATELPIIIIGREFVAQKLARYSQIKSRITSMVSFKPLAKDDFTTLLADFKLQTSGDVAGRLVSTTNGSLRLGMNAMRDLLKWSSVNKGPVTPDQVKEPADAAAR